MKGIDSHQLKGGSRTSTGHCLGYVSTAVIKHHNQDNFEGKGLFCLYFHVTVHHRGKSEQELKQGKNLEAGTKAQAMGKHYLLFAPYGLINLLFFLI